MVLVIEDEPAVFRVIKLQLESEGYAVIGETTGAGAIERATHSRLFAVLCDLGLPDMSGFDVLSQIRALKPELPVIVVTGHHEEAEGRRAFAMGAADYITKPIDFNYLTNALLLNS